MSFDNALWKAALIGIASNTNTTTLVRELKSEHLERHLSANQLARLWAYKSIPDAAVDGFPSRLKCYQLPRRSCRVIQRGVDCLRHLPSTAGSFRVVRCSFVLCFQTCITEELFRCPRAPIER
ncbi:hypothetical protein TNCV_333721 [Trichonephila clavipes]|nr:hypothetical protein TNCV_333721 [Trichonephila clavipes]